MLCGKAHLHLSNTPYTFSVIPDCLACSCTRLLLTSLLSISMITLQLSYITEMKDVTQTLDPLLTTVNKTQTPAKKAKWHLGQFTVLYGIPNT